MPTIRIQADYVGHVTSSAKTATGIDDVKVGLDGSTIYRAFARFPLMLLPESSDITRVALEVRVSAVGGSYGKWDVHPYNANGQADPEADSAATAYSRCSPSGTPYVDDSLLPRHTGRHRLLLGAGAAATACTDLEAANTAGAIFSLAIHEEGDDDAYCSIEHPENDYDSPPELIITYNETTTLQAAIQSLAKRMDRAHYQAGTLTTSSASAPADTNLNDDDNYWSDFWLLLLAGTYSGESRKVLTFVQSTGVMNLAKDFTGASGLVAFCLMPTSPELMAEALNAGVAELFPDYAYLPVAYEVGVHAHRHQEYDVPVGMDKVDGVYWRADGDDQSWQRAAFRRLDEGRVQITQDLPESGLVIRISGRQRLTQYDQTDALTLSGVSEFTVPDAGEGSLSELILTQAEFNLEKWLLEKYEPSPAVGQGAGAAPPGYSPSNRRLSLLAATIADLKAGFPKRRPPIDVDNPWV